MVSKIGSDSMVDAIVVMAAPVVVDALVLGAVVVEVAAVEVIVIVGDVGSASPVLAHAARGAISRARVARTHRVTTIELLAKPCASFR